ncbi:MAG: hypothetical protein R3E39_08315 [Anaerolineae bacterium]
MDKIKLSEILGVQQPGVFQVKSIELSGWGGEMKLSCTHGLNLSDDALLFEIHLLDCREHQWRVYAHLKHPEDQTLPTATFVNLRLGSDNHRKPLHLLTDFFGLTVSYGTLEIRR